MRKRPLAPGDILVDDDTGDVYQLVSIQDGGEIVKVVALVPEHPTRLQTFITHHLVRYEEES